MLTMLIAEDARQLREVESTAPVLMINHRRQIIEDTVTECDSLTATVAEELTIHALKFLLYFCTHKPEEIV